MEVNLPAGPIEITRCIFCNCALWYRSASRNEISKLVNKVQKQAKHFLLGRKIVPSAYEVWLLKTAKPRSLRQTWLLLHKQKQLAVAQR